MHSIKAVIWDMGGVLLREKDTIPRTRLAEQYGIKLEDLYQQIFQSRSAKLAGIGAIDEEAHWSNVSNELGIARENLPEFRKIFWSGDRVDATLISFIQSLRPKYKTALLSNAWSGARKYLQDYHNCLGVFDTIIFSAEVKLAKPDPAIYLMMLDQLKLLPQEAVFIDDLIENIQSARELGINGVHFQSPEQAMADVRSLLG